MSLFRMRSLNGPKYPSNSLVALARNVVKGILRGLEKRN
ncbi:unnamed protein product [Brassica rapa subsp. narinosa]